MERKITPIRRKSKHSLDGYAINCSPPNKRDQTIALELFRSSAFLIVNKNLLKAWGPAKTVFLENLIDKYKYWVDRRMIQPDGSFFLTHEDQCKQTGLGEHQVRECKREFINMGVLHTKMKGLPAKEYYRIDFSKLLNIFIEIEENNIPALGFSEDKPYGKSEEKTPGKSEEKTPGKSEEKTPGKSEDIKDNKYKDNKYKDIYFSQPSVKRNISLSDSENETNKFGSSIEENSGSPVKEINIPFLPLAKKLATIIQSNKNINISPLRLASWAADIGKLSRIEGVPPQRIDQALDWYADNIGGQYIPVIESGGSLRNKFIKLEEAMKRAGHSPNQLPTNIPSPKKLIQQEFRSLSNSFEKTCYIPAKALMPDLDKIGKAELAKSLIDRFKVIDQKWDILPPEKKSLSDLGPMTVLQRFIEWLGDQDWITNKDPRIFRNDKIFNSFYSEYVRNIGG